MYGKEVTAVVVARKGSTRVPNKNQLEICGEPMFLRKIRQLKRCANIDRVVFGSDSDEMLEAAGKICEAVRRDDFHCDERVASANDMIYDMMTRIKTDVVVWAHCTNPLISSGTYDKAVETFFKEFPEYDSLLSVVPLREHMWTADDAWREFAPMNYNPYQARHTPARELRPYYMQDGGIFIQPYEQMLSNRYFFGKHPMLFEVPEKEFLDINEMKDYWMANLLADPEL